MALANLAGVIVSFFVYVLLFFDIINRLPYILLFIESESSRQKRKFKVTIIVIEKAIPPYAYKYYFQIHKVRML